MYRYKVTTKAIFPRPFTGQADTKEEIEAALAWNKVALEMYGENAQLNVI